jgi:hypothetical protein
MLGTTLAVLMLGALTLTLLPPAVWPDARIPASLAAFVPSARQDLWNEATEGLRLPLHLSFVEARCSANGAVALIFEEHRPPYTETRFDYAIRGSMPASLDNEWGGGIGVSGPVLNDEEFKYTMGSSPPLCQ